MVAHDHAPDAAPEQPQPEQPSRRSLVRESLRHVCLSQALVAVHFRRDGIECIAVGKVAVVDVRSVRVESQHDTYVIPLGAVVRVDLVEKRKEPTP
jgi:hypothetical protein